MRKKNYYAAALLLAMGITGLTGCRARDYQPVDVGAVGTAEASETEAVTSAAAADRSRNVNETETMAPEPQASAVETSAVNAVLNTQPPVTFEERSETVYVTGDNVNIRLAASSSGAVLIKARRGTKLNRTGYSETWSRLEMDGQICYISSQYLSVDVPETQAVQTGTTAAAGEVRLDSAWKYADFSKINSGAAMLYRSEADNRKGITVCVNAGHGTQGGASVKTLCHPDGTPKVTGGTTGAGATTAVAVSGGMTFSDGTAEAKVTLAMAKVLKDKLLTNGYDVLMIRESDDVQLDNIARTVIANNKADCHLALHWDSTTSNKGAFYMSVPNVASYRGMEPVASNWQKHNALGESLVAGLRGAGVKIWSGGAMEMDLTQTSFSTVPSIDIELGDKASDHTPATLNTLGDGLVAGINQYFGKS